MYTASVAEAHKLRGINAVNELHRLAHAVPHATKFASIDSAQASACNSEVKRLTKEASDAALVGDLATSKSKIEAAINFPNATDRDEADKLSRAIAVATDAARVRDALLGLPDSAFSAILAGGDIPPSLSTGRADANRLLLRTVHEILPTVYKERDSRRAAAAESERVKQEQAKAAADEAARLAKAKETEEKAKAEERADFERKYEIGSPSGLVLVKESVSGKVGRFTSSVSGTVFNATGKDLRGVSIKFKMYDQSGAQVGTALAFIESLDNGERWNFKAISLNDDASTYKFSELVGR